MSYPGGKNGSGVYQTLINQVPPCDIFISGFLGNCPLFRKLRSDIVKIGFDRSLKVIREYWEGEGYHIARSNFGGPSKKPQILIADFIDNINALRSKLAMLDKRVFIFLDPPFLISHRSQGALYYEHELSDFRHKHMLKLLLTLPDHTFSIAICTYDNGLYSGMLKKWRKINYTAVTHRGQKRTETLYMNYPQPERLLDYSYLGDNFTERQNIKRKADRMIKKLSEMPVLQRNHLLQEINKKFAYCTT